MTDIVERLRKREMLAEIGQDRPEIYRDAADEIERLRAALKPFARIAEDYEEWDEKLTLLIMLRHLRDAKAALGDK